jgi:hypothetical protein
MTETEFRDHAQAATGPPPGVAPTLVALWYACRGDWGRAHTLAQEIQSPDGSWIHAHLHREEGDLDNAGYWYARADRAPATGAIEAERSVLLRHFLGA